ncbi:alpha/beta fold hydrolase [Kribbella deserti]|uniref:Alpha/beta fold hydrolase n=1 Tax=Kribbella deserti TaxID=1926257 RepID=A0ABV6QWQ3_9ACTN
MASYSEVVGRESVALAAREWPSRTVQVADVPMLVRDVPDARPDAEPALFVHGLGGSSTNWTALGLLLSDVVRGVAMDLPGFGHTPPRNDLGGINEHADTLLEFMAGEFDRPVHLFGNSMGGSIAVVLAARHPEKVASLTLISPAMPNPRPSAVAAWFIALSAPRIGPAVMRRSAMLPFDRRVKTAMSMVFGDPRSLPPEFVAMYEAELHRREEQPWIADAVLAGARSIVQSQLVPAKRSLWAEAARVTCPTLLVYGGRDRLVDSGIRNRAQQTFPNARLLYLPQSGHVAQMEHPDQVATAFRQLLPGR